MTSIAVLSQKGGVGKTLTVANLAPALAARGLRVLMVDMDPQADLSASWGIEEDEDLVRIEETSSRAGARTLTPPWSTWVEGWLGACTCCLRAANCEPRPRACSPVQATSYPGPAIYAPYPG